MFATRILAWVKSYVADMKREQKSCDACAERIYKLLATHGWNQKHVGFQEGGV